MKLNEDYTQQQCNDLFHNMLIQFRDSDDVYKDFYFDKVKKNLNFLNANNRKSLGMCKRYPVKRWYAVDDETGEMIFEDDIDTDTSLYDFDEYINDYEYEIFLNPHCLKFGEDGERIIKDTLAHELCHTCKNCFNHGKPFHDMAKRIYNDMGYVIDTKADTDASAYFTKYLPDTPYKVVCTQCGYETKLPRISDVIRNPKNYACGKCNGGLESYKLNKQTGEYELYGSENSADNYKYSIHCTDCDFSVGFKRRDKKYKDYLWSLYQGSVAPCFKCGRGSLIVRDSGLEMTPAYLQDPGSEQYKLFTKIFPEY